MLTTAQSFSILPFCSDSFELYFCRHRTILAVYTSPPDGPCGPMKNIVKDNFSGDKVQNIVIVLMAVFYNSLRFHLIYLTLLSPEMYRFIWVPTVK